MSNPKTTEASVAETLGRAAFTDKKSLDANPFSWLRDGDKRSDWSKGWFAARDSVTREFHKRARKRSMTASEAAVCRCMTCAKERTKDLPMLEAVMQPFRYACETCGNKRCPHNTDHRLSCTNSNATGQPGSAFT